MKHLIIITPYGNKYRINSEGLITQYSNNEFSGNWKFVNMTSVKSNNYIPFKSITEKSINDIRRNLLYKNGNPKWTVTDIDHGTTRVWGNTTVHGIKSIFFEEVLNQE